MNVTCVALMLFPTLSTARALNVFVPWIVAHELAETDVDVVAVSAPPFTLHRYSLNPLNASVEPLQLKEKLFTLLVVGVTVATG